VTISIRQLGSGLGVQRVLQCIGPVLRSAVKILPNENLRALIVANLLLPKEQQQSSAPGCAQKSTRVLKKCALFVERCFGVNITVKRKSEHAAISVVGSCVKESKTKVYNITVDQAHLFYANGLLSSNTTGEDHVFDEVCFLCMARPIKPVVVRPKLTMEEKDWAELQGIPLDRGTATIMDDLEEAC